MRLNPQGLTATEERHILDEIQKLKAKLPPRHQEPREPLHAVIVKTFPDGANHSRPMDLNNEWSKAGHGIREAIKQGGEVVVRPLYPGEVAQEQKYYPGRERLKILEAFVERVADPASWTHGHQSVGMLMDEAHVLMEKGSKNG